MSGSGGSGGGAAATTVQPMTLDAVNAMAPDAFVAHFLPIYNTPLLRFAVERAAAARPFASRAAMLGALAAPFLALPAEQRVPILADHDRLGRKPPTAEATGEQMRVGLLSLDARDARRIATLNDAYDAKFGFPFVLAIAGKSKHEILATFERRLARSRDEEVRTVTDELIKIVRLRLDKWVDDSGDSGDGGGGGGDDAAAVATVDAALLPSSTRGVPSAVPATLGADAHHALSPIDSRYWSRTRGIASFLSEFAFMRHRVLVEVEYLVALARYAPFRARTGGDAAWAAFDAERDGARLRAALVERFDEASFARIKELERTTRHDIKAVEYFVKERLVALEPRHAPFAEFVHFALTSQDVNNTALPMMLRGAVECVYVPALEAALLAPLRARVADWRDVPMLARTHGQPATPTRVGKELAVFVERLVRQLRLLRAVPYQCKFGGATGQFNAHHVAVAGDDVDWPRFADRLCADAFGLERQQFTTQIEHYDMLGALLDALRRINTVLVDLARDLWQYVSLDYFTQRTAGAGEVGSSAMPHKVNPIDFENAEGNAGVANALYTHLAQKLPVSRLQRDLTDSTVLRNVGVPLAHSLLAVRSLAAGLGKLQLNEARLRADLDANWAVVSEALQTVLRRERYDAPYEAVKALTRTGKQSAIGAADMASFVDGLDAARVSDSVKRELRAVTPHNFTGVWPTDKERLDALGLAAL